VLAGLVPPAVAWAARRRWRITLGQCFLVLSAAAIPASWTAVVVRHIGPGDFARFLMQSKTLSTSAIVFVASLLITLLVRAKAAARG
jgi:hypothetical protein